MDRRRHEVHAELDGEDGGAQGGLSVPSAHPGVCEPDVTRFAQVQSALDQGGIDLETERGLKFQIQGWDRTSGGGRLQDPTFAGEDGGGQPADDRLRAAIENGVDLEDLTVKSAVGVHPLHSHSATRTKTVQKRQAFIV
jgi:hypothetical protein